MEAGFSNNVHVAAKQLLSIKQQPAESKAACAWGQRHQQIDIAVLKCFVPSH